MCFYWSTISSALILVFRNNFADFFIWGKHPRRLFTLWIAQEVKIMCPTTLFRLEQKLRIFRFHLKALRRGLRWSVELSLDAFSEAACWPGLLSIVHGWAGGGGGGVGGGGGAGATSVAHPQSIPSPHTNSVPTPSSLKCRQRPSLLQPPAQTLQPP